MNKEFQVLVWEKYACEDQLGDPKTEMDFDKYNEAFDYYAGVKKFLCKMVMQYKTLEPESDGDVIDEEWSED